MERVSRYVMEHVLMCDRSKAQAGSDGHKEGLLEKAKHAMGMDKQKTEEKK